MQSFKQIFKRRNSEGTTFGAITKDDLHSLKVLRPSHDILAMYEEVVSPMFDQQNVVAAENQLLAEARDWLLPMLMNGQVTVDTMVTADLTVTSAYMQTEIGLFCRWCIGLLLRHIYSWALTLP